MKKQNRYIKYFFEVDPADLETLEEWTQYLESILNDPCSTMVIDGILILTEIKARVDKVRGMTIEIYTNEHAPPHFHVHSGSVNASFRIDDCSLLRGNISSSDSDKIKIWHKSAKPILIEKWNLLRPTNCTVGMFKEKS